MKVFCTNIGPEDLGGQLEWEGSAGVYSVEIDTRVKTAFNEDGTTRSRVDDGHVFIYTITDQDRRDLAHRQIIKYYPEWKQLNIIRNGSAENQETMSEFIDACRAWSNDTANNDPFGLDNIEP